MRRFLVVGGLTVLALGLAVGMALAAAGPGGPGGRGPGPGGPGVVPGGPGGPPPGGPGQGPGGPGMQHQGPPPLIALLEQKLGKALTEEQRGEVHKAAKAEADALKPLREAFAKKLADITGLPVEKIEELLPGGPPPPREGQGPGMGGGKGRPPEAGPGGGPGKGGPGKRGPGQGGPGQGGPGQGGPDAGGQMPPPPGAMLAKRLEQALGTPLTEEKLGQIRDAEKAHLEAAKVPHEAFINKLAEITGLTADVVKELLLPRRGPPPPHGPPPGPPQGAPPAAPPSGAQQ